MPDLKLCHFHIHVIKCFDFHRTSPTAIPILNTTDDRYASLLKQNARFETMSLSHTCQNIALIFAGSHPPPIQLNKQQMMPLI